MLPLICVTSKRESRVLVYFPLVLTEVTNSIGVRFPIELWATTGLQPFFNSSRTKRQDEASQFQKQFFLRKPDDCNASRQHKHVRARCRPGFWASSARCPLACSPVGGGTLGAENTGHPCLPLPGLHHSNPPHPLL